MILMMVFLRPLVTMPAGCNPINPCRCQLNTVTAFGLEPQSCWGSKPKASSRRVPTTKQLLWCPQLSSCVGRMLQLNPEAPSLQPLTAILRLGRGIRRVGRGSNFDALGWLREARNPARRRSRGYGARHSVLGTSFH